MEEQIGTSLPFSLVDKFADTIRKKIEAGMSADPDLKLLLKTLVDSEYQEEKAFIKKLIEEVLQGRVDPDFRAYLGWLERNHPTVTVTPLSIGQFKRKSTDLYIRDQAPTRGPETRQRQSYLPGSATHHTKITSTSSEHSQYLLHGSPPPVGQAKQPILVRVAVMVGTPFGRPYVPLESRYHVRLAPPGLDAMPVCAHRHC